MPGVVRGEGCKTLLYSMKRYCCQLFHYSLYYLNCNSERIPLRLRWGIPADSLRFSERIQIGMVIQFITSSQGINWIVILSVAAKHCRTTEHSPSACRSAQRLTTGGGELQLYVPKNHTDLIITHGADILFRYSRPFPIQHIPRRLAPAAL